ncbi:DUF4394 domain-containing protein [Conexibacter stalactiti]|uniref:DUF4394 domain-containing protein n=1 Tax=Conexibacter stalactiti TaxID=1940611 RepID=A0ABU4HZN4_9ACTN|nr:DUF4394 domain-containing protein [Conexibacter stalactiti]MDW5598379.1 DUF4394 domain-containing protein [Conexibacter stalactiti]MEC5039021.1 DUF4394 domain-containing protein [Conexibacter stalactiti]
MIARRRLRIGAPAAAVVLLSVLLAPSASAAGPAERAYALSGSNLLAFDPAAPRTTTATAITGVNAGETLVGIDVRPQNGLLYAFGVNSTANTATLYALSPETGVAGAVGTPGQIAFTDGMNPIDLPDPGTVGYGFDVNPAADRVRVTTLGVNFRVNPTDGRAVDGNTAVTGDNPDGYRASISGAAYTSSRPDAPTTALYTLEAGLDQLAIQLPPNVGTQTQQKTVTLGGRPLDFGEVSGFDIDPSVETGAAGGAGFAVLTVRGVTGLYTIDLASGAATAIGPIGNGATAIQGLALQRRAADAGYPVLALSGGNLARFQSATPGSATYAELIGLEPGEAMAALTWRPRTGQLYGLGVNATANTATLYLVDAQTGVTRAVGAARQIAFVDVASAAVDFPPLASGWAIDADPTREQVRVVADGGLSFRVNINAPGTPFDGNLGFADPIAGTNPDRPHSGLDAGATGVTAAAFTNAFGGATATTLYALEPTANKLYLQGPPNAGTLIDGRTVTLRGAPLDFGARASLDLPSDVQVTTSNSAASGSGVALLPVGGVNGLYRLDLATAGAVFLGAAPAGVSGIAVGRAWGTPLDPAPGRDEPAGPGGPAPGGPGSPGPATPTPPLRDITKPLVTRVAVASKRRRRLTITFTVSEAGTATIRIVRERPGRRKGKACALRARRGRRCTVSTSYGTLTRAVRAGRVTVVVAGRVGRRALSVGSIRVEVTVRDAAGNRSRSAVKRATVKR